VNSKWSVYLSLICLSTIFFLASYYFLDLALIWFHMASSVFKPHILPTRLLNDS